MVLTILKGKIFSELIFLTYFCWVLQWLFQSFLKFLLLTFHVVRDWENWGQLPSTENRTCHCAVSKPGCHPWHIVSEMGGVSAKYSVYYLSESSSLNFAGINKWSEMSFKLLILYYKILIYSNHHWWREIIHYFNSLRWLQLGVSILAGNETIKHS